MVEGVHGSPESRRRRRLGWLFRALAVPALLFLGLVGVVNLLVNLALPPVINETPEKVRVTWAFALTLWPGHLRVWGLHIDGTGRNDRWALHLPYASGTIDLPLLAERHFRATGLFARHGTFTYAMRDDPEPNRPRSPKGPWVVDLPDLVSRDMGELAVGQHRFVGSADLTGTLLLGQEEVVADLALDVAHGTVQVAEHPLLSTLKGRTTAKLEGLPRLGSVDRSAMEQTAIRTDLTFHATDLGALGVYLEKAPWLTLGGEADVTLEADLVGGVLAPGSHAEAVTQDLTVGFRSYRIVGDASLAVQVDGEPGAERTHGEARIGRFRILDGSGEALVQGSNFGIAAEAGPVEWAAPPEDLSVRLVLPSSELQSPSAWNTLLPTGVGIALVDGRGTAEGELSADVGAGTASGTLRLDASDVEVTWDELRVVSDLSVDVALPEADLDAGRYTFSGSQARVSKYGYVEEPPEERDWWAALTLDRGVATVGADTYLEATFRLRCANSAPFVEVAASRTKVPGLVASLLTVKDLAGTTGVELQKDALMVRGLHLEGGPAEVHMDLLRRGKTNHGALLARYGPVWLGLGIEGGERTWHPVGARGWWAQRDVLPAER